MALPNHRGTPPPDSEPGEWTPPPSYPSQDSQPSRAALDTPPFVAAAMRVVPPTRTLDAVSTMRRWQSGALTDHAPAQSMARLPFSIDAAALWYGMRAAGLERRAMAGRLLYQSAGGGMAPDPEIEYHFSQLAVAHAAAMSFQPALPFVQAPAAFADAVDRADPHHEGEALAWFVSTPGSRVPQIMARAMSNQKILAWQVAMLIGYFTKEAAMFMNGIPGILNLIPPSREQPQLVSLLHRYAEGLLRLAPCEREGGCLCADTRAHYNRPPPDPLYPDLPRQATDTLERGPFRQPLRSRPAHPSVPLVQPMRSHLRPLREVEREREERRRRGNPS